MLSEKMQRVRATLKGETTDRIPYSLWSHFPGIDLDPVQLADASYDFYKKLDLDFIKNMSNGLFSIEDWGCECDFSEIATGGVAKVTKFGVEKPEDWEKLKRLDVTSGALGRELTSLSRLLNHMKDEAPVLVTVFSPLTTAQKLCGGQFFTHLRTQPEKVKAGLEIIVESTVQFAAKALAMGCAGVYFASQLSTYDKLSEAEYKEFGVHYDLKVLEALQKLSWFNVMHIHGDNIMFDLLKDYPVQGISWHVWETVPEVGEFLQKAPGKCIVGGLERYHITDNCREDLATEIDNMAKITGGKRLFIAPGCVIRAPFNLETLLFIKEKVFAQKI